MIMCESCSVQEVLVIMHTSGAESVRLCMSCMNDALLIKPMPFPDLVIVLAKTATEEPSSVVP